MFFGSFVAQVQEARLKNFEGNRDRVFSLFLNLRIFEKSSSPINFFLIFKIFLHTPFFAPAFTSTWATLPITYKLVSIVDTKVGGAKVSNNLASGPNSRFFKKYFCSLQNAKFAFRGLSFRSSLCFQINLRQDSYALPCAKRQSWKKLQTPETARPSRHLYNFFSSKVHMLGENEVHFRAIPWLAHHS